MINDNKDTTDESVDDLNKTVRSLKRMSEKIRLSAGMPADVKSLTISQGGAVGQLTFSLAMSLVDEYDVYFDEALDMLLKEAILYVNFACSMLDESVKLSPKGDKTKTDETICPDKV